MKNKIIGIYKITTLHNNKIYIGSSNDVLKRFKTHISRLNRNVHHSSYLQNTFNKYGITNLNFEIIEILDNSSIQVQREQYWMDRLQSYDKQYGYNVCKIAGINDTGKKQIHQYDLEGNFLKTWESIKSAKIGLKGQGNISGVLNGRRQKAFNSQWSVEKFKKIPSILKLYAKYDLLGNLVEIFNYDNKEIPSKQGLADVHKAIKDETLCDNYYWKKYNSYEDVLKNIKVRKRKQAWKKVVKLTVNDEELQIFNSITEAALDIGVNAFQVSRVLRSNTMYKTCRGFKYKYYQG